MNHFVLLGDSIFDNGPYVGPGDSVAEILRAECVDASEVTLLAVDGDVTTDVAKQISYYPASATRVFVSCGGNDALRVANVLNQRVSTIEESLEVLSDVISIYNTH